MLDEDEPVEASRDSGDMLSDGQTVQEPKGRGIAETTRPEIPALDDTPLPDELTGRASKTSEDLTALFRNETPEHLTDGFRGASGDDPDDAKLEDTQPPST